MTPFLRLSYVSPETVIASYNIDKQTKKKRSRFCIVVAMIHYSMLTFTDTLRTIDFLCLVRYKVRIGKLSTSQVILSKRSLEGKVKCYMKLCWPGPQRHTKD